MENTFFEIEKEPIFYALIYGQGMFGSLVPSILDMGLACRGSMAILDLHICFGWVKVMIKNVAF